MRRAWIALLGFGLVAGAPVAFGHATFSDPAAAPSRAFSTDRVDISAGPNQVLVGFSGTAPGDEVGLPLTISNAGTVPVRYTMTTRIDGSSVLSDGLTLTVKSDVMTCSNTGPREDGTEIYHGSQTVPSATPRGDRIQATARWMLPRKRSFASTRGCPPRRPTRCRT